MALEKEVHEKRDQQISPFIVFEFGLCSDPDH